MFIFGFLRLLFLMFACLLVLMVSCGLRICWLDVFDFLVCLFSLICLFGCGSGLFDLLWFYLVVWWDVALFL